MLQLDSKLEEIGMTKRYVLTFDIDWAPDFVILDCLNILDEIGKQATFFTTHETPMNDEITDRGHILGIHPNFFPNSTQGSDVEVVIEKCLTYAPHAWCMRTHGLVQSTPLLYEIFSKFPQLKLDVSLLMHRSPFAHKCRWEFEDVSFDRLLYNWEDDLEFCHYKVDEKKPLFFGKLTVFDFHPFHVFLNSSDGTEYRNLKRENVNTPLNELNLNVLTKYKNPKVGTRNHLMRILESDFACIGLDEI